MIRKKDHSEQRSTFIVIGLVFVVALVFSFRIKLTGFGDDDNLFLNPLINEHGGSYLSFLKTRYSTWSSRIIIEIITLVSVQHHLIWRILNSIVMTMCAVLPAFLFKKTKDVKPQSILLSVILFGLVPNSMFSETGWIATTTNYVFAAAMGLLALLSSTQLFVKKEPGFLIFIIGLVATLYAANQEQMLALLLGLNILFFIALCRSKKREYIATNIIFIILSAIVIVSAKGNKIRYESEVSRWFPDFESLSFIKKIELGFASTMRHLFFDNQWVVLIFLASLLVLLYLKYRRSVFTVFAAIPLVGSLIISNNQLFKINWITNMLNSFGQYGTSFTISDPKTWAADLILMIFLVCVLISIMLYFEFKVKALFVSIIFLGLIFTRMMMGFSPTIWASATRTFLFTYIGINCLTVCIWSNQNYIDVESVSNFVKKSKEKFDTTR